MRRWLGIAAATIAIMTAAAATTAVQAAPLPVPGTGVVTGDDQPAYSWNDQYQSVVVHFPSRRSGAVLAGTLYGPKNLARLGRVPAVVAIPPSGGVGNQGSVAYEARSLAQLGMIGLTVDPQGVGNSESLGDPACTGEPGRTNPSPCPNVPFQQMDNFFDAGQSALDFLLGHDEPWLGHVNRAEVGALGHSEGARAASYLQDPHFDGRVHAVVALDNLSSDYYADQGAPSQEGAGGSTGLQNAIINGQPYGALGASIPVTPVAPGLGLASDSSAGQPTDEKKAAYEVWRQHGVPSMELVLAGVNHLQFSQSATADEDRLHRIATYTGAWFAWFFQHQPWALRTLTARSVLGMPLSQYLSANYRSGLFLPAQHLDCEDFRTGCPAR